MLKAILDHFISNDGTLVKGAGFADYKVFLSANNVVKRGLICC